MNYLEMLDFHLSRDSDMTVAAVPVPRAQGSSFGILKIDETGAVENFLEKPADPPGLPDNPDFSLVSMGVYVFRAETLVQEIIQDAKKKASSHDFGKDIIPQMVGGKKVFAYNFQDKQGRPCYWRDIGLLDAYFQAHQDLLGVNPTFELFDPTWPMRNRPQILPPSKFVSAGTPVGVEDSLIASGCVIEGTVRRAVLSPSVKVGPGARVDECILWEGVEIGAGARVRQAIIEDGVKVPPGFSIGYNAEADAQRFTLTDHGVVVVPNNVRLEE
jgi:glucose-1-phosphate adenylyltransferase